LVSVFVTVQPPVCVNIKYIRCAYEVKRSAAANWLSAPGAAAPPVLRLANSAAHAISATRALSSHLRRYPDPRFYQTTMAT
jgi:hypothetical protein